MSVSSHGGVDAASVPTQATGAGSVRLEAETFSRPRQTVVLEAGHARANYWRDLWRYRELFAILAWRDLALRHRQSVLGMAWSVIRPLMTVLIFTVVFGRIAKLPSDGMAPYALMVFAGIIPWNLLSGIIGQASNSLISNAGLIGKVYFPRLLVPATVVAVTLVDGAITLVLFFVTMAWFGFVPDLRILLLPVFIVFAVLAGLGPALWLSAVNVKYRDFQHVAAFALQFGVYISPVGFSSTAVPDQWRLLYSLNPVVGVIDGFRWCLFHGEAQLYVPGLLCSLGITALMLWVGVAYFRKAERTFVDVI
jgi:lipopolysaccharide transport system permease protein